MVLHKSYVVNGKPFVISIYFATHYLRRNLGYTDPYRGSMLRQPHLLFRREKIFPVRLVLVCINPKIKDEKDND
jgi:hypothetical protein